MCIIQYNYTEYHAFAYGATVKGFVPVIVSYIIFILCYFRKFRELSLKQVVVKNEYLMFLVLITIYIIYAAITCLETNMQFLIEYDAYILNVVIMIRSITYVYIHSFAEDIKLTKVEWTTRLLWYYQGVLELDAQKIEQSRFDMYIAKVLEFVNLHPIVSATIAIILGGPQFLVLLEVLRLSGSIRKLTKKHMLFILDASILLNLLFITFVVILTIILYSLRLAEF
ncbi:hypothetical protein RZE82_06525 [Mollicutes bacterium LVI A0039]|nr:hypothetical protein RZE82_06525 [Mollicutes bacterium LVI A0039]